MPMIGPKRTISGLYGDEITIENAISVLDSELKRAREKHPGNRWMFTALMEEVGEMVDARMHDSSNYRIEALQVACVAMRIATEGAPIHSPEEDFPMLNALVRMGEAAQQRLHALGIPD